MKKKNRPVQQAVNSDIRTSDYIPDHQQPQPRQRQRQRQRQRYSTAV
ncbi:TPA: hypothetical protein ACWV6M_004967 [Salmonella enterica subsp. enterica serovar Muenchen]